MHLVRIEQQKTGVVYYLSNEKIELKVNKQNCDVSTETYSISYRFENIEDLNSFVDELVQRIDSPIMEENHRMALKNA